MIELKPSDAYLIVACGIWMRREQGGRWEESGDARNGLGPPLPPRKMRGRGIVFGVRAEFARCLSGVESNAVSTFLDFYSSSCDSNPVA